MIWQSWRMTGECESESISEQMREEALRAVRDFRSVQGIWPRSEKSRPEVPRDSLVDMYQLTNQSTGMPPIFDIEAEVDVRAAQMRWYMQYIERNEWLPWYEPQIPLHHQEPLPSWDSGWITDLEG